MLAEGPASEHGGKVQNNTLFPKTAGDADASEKMREVYLTGDDTDLTRAQDPRYFRGQVKDSEKEQPAELEGTDYVTP
ncbi:MAG: hypothetical protein ACRD1R_09685 [Acidobacteriota bacterium]